MKKGDLKSDLDFEIFVIFVIFVIKIALRSLYIWVIEVTFYYFEYVSL
jgi:hypothetical protein